MGTTFRGMGTGKRILGSEDNNEQVIGRSFPDTPSPLPCTLNPLPLSPIAQRHWFFLCTGHRLPARHSGHFSGGTLPIFLTIWPYLRLGIGIGKGERFNKAVAADDIDEGVPGSGYRVPGDGRDDCGHSSSFVVVVPRTRYPEPGTLATISMLTSRTSKAPLSDCSRRAPSSRA